MNNKRPPEITNTAAKAQCFRLLTALEEAGDRGISTLEARDYFNILAPAARVHQLRWEHGKNIITRRVRETNAQGHPHYVARYILLSGAWEAQR